MKKIKFPTAGSLALFENKLEDNGLLSDHKSADYIAKDFWSDNIDDKILLIAKEFRGELIES